MSVNDILNDLKAINYSPSRGISPKLYNVDPITFFMKANALSQNLNDTEKEKLVTEINAFVQDMLKSLPVEGDYYHQWKEQLEKWNGEMELAVMQAIKNKFDANHKVEPQVEIDLNSQIEEAQMLSEIEAGMKEMEAGLNKLKQVEMQPEEKKEDKDLKAKEGVLKRRFEELQTTEKTYSDTLKLLIGTEGKDGFKKIVDESVGNEKLKEIFKKLKEIHDVQSAISKMIINAGKESDFDYGEFSKLVSKAEKQYVEYVRLNPAGGEIPKEISEKFKKLDKEGLGLNSRLIQPIQRIPRYKLLLNEIERDMEAVKQNVNNPQRKEEIKKRQNVIIENMDEINKLALRINAMQKNFEVQAAQNKIKEPLTKYNNKNKGEKNDERSSKQLQDALLKLGLTDLNFALRNIPIENKERFIRSMITRSRDEIKEVAPSMINVVPRLNVEEILKDAKEIEEARALHKSNDIEAPTDIKTKSSVKQQKEIKEEKPESYEELKDRLSRSLGNRAALVLSGDFSGFQSKPPIIEKQNDYVNWIQDNPKKAIVAAGAVAVGSVVLGVVTGGTALVAAGIVGGAAYGTKKFLDYRKEQAQIKEQKKIADATRSPVEFLHHEEPTQNKALDATNVKPVIFKKNTSKDVLKTDDTPKNRESKKITPK